MSAVEQQKEAFETIFSADLKRWEFHDTKNPLIRYLRDRRLNRAMRFLESHVGSDLRKLSVLCVCGGVGGEATYFANRGFIDVTNSDFSANALEVCKKRDSRLKTLQLNAENMDIPGASYDLVVVQDGLHHLPRPVLGLNEMVRVARVGVVVIEPHLGLIGKLIGTEWERHDDAVNYVFRWNVVFFNQVLRSQILERPATIQGIRLWDHNVVIGKVVSIFGGGALSLAMAKLLYAALSPLNPCGNNFVGCAVWPCTHQA